MDPKLAESIAVGSSVISSDDHKVGVVASVHASTMHVEKGFIFIHDYEVPLTAIASVDEAEGEVRLNVTKDVALSSKWEIEDDFDDFADDDDETEPYDNPIDGDGNRVLTGAAETPSLPIFDEVEEGEPPLLASEI